MNVACSNGNEIYPVLLQYKLYATQTVSHISLKSINSIGHALVYDDPSIFFLTSNEHSDSNGCQKQSDSERDADAFSTLPPSLSSSSSASAVVLCHNQLLAPEKKEGGRHIGLFSYIFRYIGSSPPHDAAK
jgi:hypothetical protein